MSKLDNEVFRLYQEGKSLDEISTMLGISREMVRVVILRKMKSS